MKKNKIFVSDIDDTLVKENDKPSQELVDEIKSIVDGKAMFILATARSIDSVEKRFGKNKINIISRSRSVNYR